MIATLMPGGPNCSRGHVAEQRRPARSAEAMVAPGALRFDPNRGQFDAPVRFAASGRGYRLFLTRDGATLSLGRPDRPHDRTVAGHASTTRNAQTSVVSLSIVGARPVEPSGIDKLAGASNYFVGADQSRWRSGVEGYARVRYAGVLPGVDVEYYGTGERRLEYDLVLAPGADPRAVELAFHGPAGVDLAADGSAKLRLTAGGDVQQPAPVAYQRDADGVATTVAVRYEQRSDGSLGFAVGGYDRRRALVIDPVLIYSTYLGGSGTEEARGVAVDAAGNTYVAGTTQSSDFPTASAFQGVNNGSPDVFVTKLGPNGASLIYSTYLGGSAADEPSHLAVDAAGSAYVTGYTLSNDFPTVPAAGGSGGGKDAFVAKLSPSGSALVYSKYVGGSGDEVGLSVNVDASSNAYVTGWTTSSNFPTRAPLQASNQGGADAFLVKLTSGGSFLYSTYLGGSSNDQADGVAIDAAGNVYLAGNTTSTNFPTLLALQPALSGGQGGEDAFIAKITPSGSSLLYSTYLGGTNIDAAHGVVIDSAGDAIVAGETWSPDFPTVSPYQSNLRGTIDAFAAKLNPTGSGLIYSTYLGGSALDWAEDVAIDPAGHVYLVGDSSSTDFPLVTALQPFGGGPSDAFVAELGTSGASLVYSTYLGGSGLEYGHRIAVDSSGSATVAGFTNSTDFPTWVALQPALDGAGDSFVTRLSNSSQLPILNLAALYCIFSPSCGPLLFGDHLSDPYSVTNSPTQGVLSSGTVVGQPGTPAGGMRAFLYSLDMTQVAPGAPCVARLDLDFGTPASIDLDGNGTPDTFLVFPVAGSGQVAPTSVQLTGGTVSVSLSVCPGQSSLTFGLMAPASAQVRTAATVTESGGATHPGVHANVPALSAGAAVPALPPGLTAALIVLLGLAGLTLARRTAGSRRSAFASNEDLQRSS
jgi:hypothetical protein